MKLLKSIAAHLLLVAGIGALSLSGGVASAQPAPAATAAPQVLPAKTIYAPPAAVVQPTIAQPAAPQPMAQATKPAASQVIPAVPAPNTAPATAAPAPTAANTNSTVTVVDGYVLGPGDIIDIGILGRTEFNSHVQVQIDGTIQLPFLGSIVASNRTVLQLRDDIRRGLMNGGYYADPAVNVTVATFASRYVVVLGEVGAPGLVAVDRAYRVSEIMAKVGGIRSSGSDIISLRRASGEEITLDFNKVSVGGAAEDPVVNPGDKIFVAKAESFYIYGQISQPGTFPLAREMSVQMALARAGGLTPQGSEKKVKLYRNGVQVGRLKLSDIVKGGDVIVVGERFF